MFGYVLPSERHLNPEDQARFRAAYCGLCRVLGERYGLAARCILNYDFTFLALLLWPPEVEEAVCRPCIAHPVHGRECLPANPALELAADCSVILAWWQARDALADPGGGKLAYRALSGALSGAYERASSCRPAFDSGTREQMERLGRLERENCPTMDEPADTFARLLSGVSAEVADPVKRRVLEQLLYHLGRWIYLVDAADDLAGDFASGSYNPLIPRFSLYSGALPEEAKETLAASLDHSIRLMGAAFELWDFGLWSNIIRATIYEGLFLVGKSVLDRTFHARRWPRSALGRSKETL